MRMYKCRGTYIILKSGKGVKSWSFVFFAPTFGWDIYDTYEVAIYEFSLIYVEYTYKSREFRIWGLRKDVLKGLFGDAYVVLSMTAINLLNYIYPSCLLSSVLPTFKIWRKGKVK